MLTKQHLLIVTMVVFAIGATTTTIVPYQTNASIGSDEFCDDNPDHFACQGTYDDVGKDEDDEEDDESESVTCWNGEEVSRLSDCPEDDGEIVCNDGSTAVKISDCPTGSSPPPNPYCDKVDYKVTCHDRKDYSEVTGLYPCNDGTDKVDWRDCEDATEK